MTVPAPLALRAGRILCACLGLFLSFAASADSDCDGSGEAHVLDARKSSLGAGHHPVGKPMPETATFNQPTRCAEGVWFFDLNGNGLADAGEPRLFGPRRVIDCGSCHGDSPDAKSVESGSVFLRLDASRLCLVCHKL